MGFLSSFYICKKSPMLRRPRRNRKTAAIRSMVEENKLSTADFMYPMFLLEGKSKSMEVESMPGIYRLSVDLMLKEIETCSESWN